MEMTKTTVTLDEPDDLELSPDQRAIREQVAVQLRSEQAKARFKSTQPVKEPISINRTVDLTDKKKQLLNVAPTSEDKACTRQELIKRIGVGEGNGYILTRDLIDSGQLSRTGKGVTHSPFLYWRKPEHQMTNIDPLGWDLPIAELKPRYEVEITATVKRTIYAASVEEALAQTRELPGFIDVLGIRKVNE